MWLNRMRSGGRRKKITFIVISAIVSLLVWSIFESTYTSLLASDHRDDENISTALQLGALVFFVMLCFSNFACSLAIFYGAKDVPFLLALPISRRNFLAARGLVSCWNASWSTLLFGAPMFAGVLAVGDPSWVSLVVVLAGLAALLFLAAAIGILLSTLFVNVIPMTRFLEFFAVLITVFVLSLTFLAPEIGPEMPRHVRTTHGLEPQVLKTTLEFLQIFPSSLFSRSIMSALAGRADIGALSNLLLWCFAIGAITEWVFRRLFLRGWDFTFGLTRRERTLSTPGGGSLLLSQQTLALVRKERRMFLRDPAQAIQLLVILLLTFLYLFNLKNLRSLSFAAEESARWWQGVLGLANISLGGCIAAAIATRFVFTSVSIEGRAYPLIRATPMSLSKFLMGKYIAWFWPVCLITTTLLLSGGFALQLSELSLIYTFVISVSLTLGLVGLGVGMGAVYAHFDWDHSSSLQSSFGSLLFMLLSFVLILGTLLPAGFLFFTASVPNFGAELGFFAQFVPQLVAVLVVIAMNVIVARGAINAGRERLLELERS